VPRVSEHFALGLTQPALDFVDVDVVGDVPLFVDPRAIERLDSDWGQECLDLLRDFFERVLAAIRDGREADGLRLLAGLGEPNETHLGFSTKRAKGSGVGKGLAYELWTALSQSQAGRTGLLQHLEDTALLIEGVNIDRVSDIATNIIREPLIRYTQEQCELLDIRMEQVGSGPTWDFQTGEWEPERYAMLPAGPNGALLFVPKIIVRKRLDFDPTEYYRKYILTYLIDLELESPTSALVRTLKSGKKKVYAKDMDEATTKRYGGVKNAIITITDKNPDLLSNYRADKEKVPDLVRKPVTLDEFATVTGPMPDWMKLCRAVTSLSPGPASASKYHRRVEGLLTALFYPTLTNAKREKEIDQGRKRVDIRYTNSGMGGGFFAWLARNYPPQPFLYVECKNYSDDIGNPELDQLTGRFNLGMGGNIGLLVNRGFTDKPKFIERCRDAALKNRGYVIPLDDEDLTELAVAMRNQDPRGFFGVLEGRFSELIE
jgi:hypothetical protein